MWTPSRDMVGLQVLENKEVVVAPQRPLVGVGDHHNPQEIQIREAEGDDVVVAEVDHPVVQYVAQAACAKAPLACKEVEE